MSLLPDNQTELLDEYLAEEVEMEDEPTKTYRLDFDTGEFSGMVDDEDALKQFIIKALTTKRAHFHMYTDDYGCELEYLIGSDVSEAFIQAEIPRMVREALIYDDRIDDVSNVTADKVGDSIFIDVEVESIYGNITQGVAI